MSYIGRRLFAALTEDMTSQEAAAAKRDLQYAAVALGLVLAAWLAAVYLNESHNSAMQLAREEGALQVMAEAKLRAQREAESHWLPQVIAAYQQGLYDECERQRVRSGLALSQAGATCRLEVR